MDSLDNASYRTDFKKSTYAEIEVRQKILAGIIEEAHNRKQPISEQYLKYHMRLAGYQNYTRNILYKDRLALDSQNNYIRDFLPRYSQVQQDIFNKLDEYERELDGMMAEPLIIQKRMIRDTKDGQMVTVITEDHTVQNKRECIKIGVKVQELKQKHCEGQNIQIAAVVVQKEFQQLKQKIQYLKEEKKQLTTSDSITDDSEKKK